MLHPTPADIEYMLARVGEDRRQWLVGGNVASLVLVFLSVGLRILSRVKIGTRVGLDDWLICLAATLASGHIISQFVAVSLGMGRHAVLVTDIKALAICNLIAQMCYNLCIPTIKLSILSLYGRIFHRTTGWFTPTLYISASFIFLYTIPSVFTYLFRCLPIESLWTDLGPQRKISCINFQAGADTQAVIIAFGTINILTDWWVLLLPLPVVINLQLEKRAKWSICSLFLIGGFVCVVSIIRLVYARKVDSVDPSWDFSPIALISSIECASGILAACMPTWRPLFKFLHHGINSIRSNNKSGFGNGEDISELGTGGSRSRSKRRTKRYSTAAMRMEHNMGSSMLGKRSDTTTSSASTENILATKTVEIELAERIVNGNKDPNRLELGNRKVT
ncbi:hypothetical protein CC78DRAFT_545766 [Lojkania enalia]|uniref:Rhodopsin domain-containing protein n=1 Tax=Lojkania enalia TaxID=147567 RepID=A0A9P4K6K2_9PLEO|nr:hypothetical protein CC78DRAFT_545766 [Didymosphaeria enalia]